MSFRSYFNPKDGLLDPEGLFIVNMSANTKKGVEKAIVDKGLGKKHGHYIIFMVSLDTVRSFAFFHALLQDLSF